MRGVIRHRILQANLIAQMGIILTGAIVRLTASGLGCPTWPECVPGSITPTSAQTQGWHKYIEYGNRTLTGVLLVVAVATIWAARGQSPLARRLSWATLAGIAAQAVLGGITVLTGLNPLTVAAHFLVSAVLVAASAALLWRASDRAEQPIAVPAILRSGIRLQTALAFIIVTIGTLVTGSGPHAGDSSEVPRLPFDWRTIACRMANVGGAIDGYIESLRYAAERPELPFPAIRQINIGIQQSDELAGDASFWNQLADDDRAPESLRADLTVGADVARAAYARLADTFRSLTDRAPVEGSVQGSVEVQLHGACGRFPRQRTPAIDPAHRRHLGRRKRARGEGHG